MEKFFHVNILTPEKKIFEGDISSLVVPAAFGYLGVLGNHAPLIANLTTGRITYKDNRNSQKVVNNKGKGFIEVLKNKVTILLDSVD